MTIDRELQALIIAANESGMGTCVRVKYNDEVLIRTTAEFGADAVVVPHCRTAEDARKMVQAVRFPPYGVRGSARIAEAQAMVAILTLILESMLKNATGRH